MIFDRRGMVNKRNDLIALAHESNPDTNIENN